MEEALQWMWNHIWTLVIFLSLFIEITPIKWSPLTSLFNWLGKKMTASACQNLELIKQDLAEQREMIQTNEKDRIRWEILDFANSCRNNIKHTKDEFQHIVALNDKYQTLLAATNDKNGVFDSEYEYIKALYKERQEKNDFL